MLEDLFQLHNSPHDMYVIGVQQADNTYALFKTLRQYFQANTVSAYMKAKLGKATITK